MRLERQLPLRTTTTTTSPRSPRSRRTRPAPRSICHAHPLPGIRDCSETSRRSPSRRGSAFAAKSVPDFIGPVRASSHDIASGHAFAKHVVKKVSSRRCRRRTTLLGSSSVYGHRATIDARCQVVVGRSTTRETIRSSSVIRTRRTVGRSSGRTTGSTTSTTC